MVATPPNSNGEAAENASAVGAGQNGAAKDFDAEVDEERGVPRTKDELLLEAA